MTSTGQKTPYAIANEAAEAIRQLNHATLNAKEMTAPEISSTVRELADMIGRLPQTFEQLASHLKKQRSLDAVLMEDGRDPAAPVAEVLAALHQAVSITEPANRETWGTPAGPLAHALSEASGWLYNMGASYNPDEDKDSEG